MLINVKQYSGSWKNDSRISLKNFTIGTPTIFRMNNATGKQNNDTKPVPDTRIVEFSAKVEVNL